VPWGKGVAVALARKLKFERKGAGGGRRGEPAAMLLVDILLPLHRLHHQRLHGGLHRPPPRLLNQPHGGHMWGWGVGDGRILVGWGSGHGRTPVGRGDGQEWLTQRWGGGHGIVGR